ncbi:protein SPA1-RELATED 4-like isoform X2 [Bidens hawaiensis]|uniref:protein SPA1-RELATED 4-like isoform X2 n=1 Tax=Bidens hawaiensis TaxID=980011 RepID=UPI00404937D7
MENSSESNWGNLNLNSSTVSSRNPRRIPDKTVNNRLESQSGYIDGAVIRSVEPKDISLRRWLDKPDRVVDPLDCLHIFMQIVEIVNLAHSQGIAVQNVRPSCFVVSSFNRVSFIESVSSSDSGSDSCEDELNNQTAEFGSTVGQNSESSLFPMKQVLQMESSWYTSPEEASGGASSCASDVYRLGVLLFELYCTSSSVEEKNATMCNLKHRVFPPQLLLKWPKEALFCLWLLHPEPSSRPKIDEVLKSEFLNEPRDDLIEREAFIELKEKIDEQELLLEFLLMLQQRKQEAADNLRRTVAFISSDLQEVAKLQTSISQQQGLTSHNDESTSSGSRKRVKIEPEHQENTIVKSSRLMKNFKKLESAYFSTRRRALKPLAKPSNRSTQMSSDGNSFLSNNQSKRSGWINSFIDGLSKYLSFRNLKVKADLKQGDLLNSSNLVFSLGFDRDGEFFATAGVNKKIKVFEYESILNENRDIHYPVVEMSSGSKLSSICWNNYIKGQIASSNFEGVVQIWDVTRNQVYMELKEHERRVWSVDFSWSNPTLIASGSDDGSVKLWNINQGTSVGTIKTKANVCCVQFPFDSVNTLAFGSADHRVYYYDLRNPSVPLFTLIGHNKTVSYVKFIDSSTLVSSSTDNTLKLWDLTESMSQVIDTPLQTFTGHMNVKNFVGLSVSDGYIATGSETNEVVVYHKAFPMPALSYKFSTTDLLSGDEVEGSDQFISSVCWRVQSSTLVAANSMGNIKLLDMV